LTKAIMTQVFISYARKDLPIVEQLATDLKKAGLDVWYDLSGLAGGSRWRIEIEKAIHTSQYVLVVLSPDAVVSEWVEREYLFSSAHGKKIIPLYYRPCDLPMYYLNVQYIDIQGENYKGNFNEILRTLGLQPVATKKTPATEKAVEPRVAKPVSARPIEPKAKEKKQEISKLKVESAPRKWNWLMGSGLGDPRKLVKQLKDASKRDQAATNLVKLGADAAPALIEALQTRDQDLLSLYQQILTRIGSAATPALTHSLLNDHPLIRGQVAEVLAKTKDPKAAPALLKTLRGEFYTVRARAALALGAIGEKKAVPLLLEQLHDEEAEARSGAVRALGMFNLPDSFDNMADLLLEDPQINVRQAAARALGETRHSQALSYLMIALRDPFWWYEREQAAEVLLDAIAGMGRMAVDTLLEALKDNEGTIRRFAARLLGRIKDPRAIDALGMALYDTHFEVGAAAAESLAGFGGAGLKVLAEALHHPETWLRQHAIAGLTLSGDKRIVPAILEMLNDPEREVQKQAIQSLGKLKDGRALPVLQAIAIDRRDQEMYKLARRAIETLKKQ